MNYLIKITVLIFLVCIGIATGFTSLSLADPNKVVYVECGSSSSETTATTIQEAVWKTGSNGTIYVDSCYKGYDGFAITNTYNLTIQPLPGKVVQITGTGVYFNPKCTSGSCSTKTAIYIAPQDDSGNIVSGRVHDITIRGITITGNYTSALVIREVTNTKINLTNINVNVNSQADCVSSTALLSITDSDKYPMLFIQDTTGTYNFRKNWWGSESAPFFKTNTPTYSIYKNQPSLAAVYSGTITKTVNTSNCPIPGIIDAITLTNVSSAMLVSFNNAPKTCAGCGITPTKYFDVYDVALGSATPRQITLTVCDANAFLYYDVATTGWKPARPITPTDSWVMLELSDDSEPSLSLLRSGITGTFFVAGFSSGSGSSTTTSSSSTTTSSATTTTTSTPPSLTTTSVPSSGGGGGTGEPTVPVLQTTGYIGFVFPADDTVHTIQTQSFSVTNLGGGTLEWSIGEPSYTGGSGWIIAISPQAGTNSGFVQVTVDRSRAPQAAGRYEAKIPITSNGGSDNVLVRLTVQESGGGGGGEPPAGIARLTVSPQSVAFDPSTTEQVVTAQNTGDAAGSWELFVRYDAKANNWLTVNPLSIVLDPNDSEQIALLVNRNGLAPDTYSASVDFIAETDNDTAAATIDVQMEVAALPELKPVLAVDKTLFFAGSGINSISISISNTGTGTLTWSTGNIQYRGLGSGWLSINPQSGSLGQGQRTTITATIDRNAVRLFGIYSATFPITSNGGNRNITILMWKPLFRR